MLEIVQHVLWPGPNLLAAGALTVVGQIILRRLTSGNGIDITEAISEFGDRLPAIRTLRSAVLSIQVVGMGASLGREGAPKQVGAVLANSLADRAHLSDESSGGCWWPALRVLAWRQLMAYHLAARCSPSRSCVEYSRYA
jgi:H+/Cl- antiporter ClcA